MTTTSLPRRHKRSRAKGSRLPEGVLSVTRPSRYGNRFRFAMAYELGYAQHGDPESARQAVVAAFTDWLGGNRDWAMNEDADRQREQILTGLPSLRGRELACWCPEDAAHCHANVLIEWANMEPAELAAKIQRIRDRVDRSLAYHGWEPIIRPAQQAA